MQMPETIAELAALEQQLMTDLQAVRVRISERAGQVDPEPEPEQAATAKKATAKKTRSGSRAVTEQ